MKNQHLLFDEAIPFSVVNYLNSCELKQIVVSQAKNAWEITFLTTRELPTPEIEDFLRLSWQKSFGCQYQFIFHFEKVQSYDDLAELCQNNWAQLMDKLCAQIPSCKGWLEGSDYVAEGDTIQLILRQELGCHYLLSRGADTILAKILAEDYHFPGKKVLIISSEAPESEENETIDLDEIENRYIDRFKEINQNAAKENHACGGKTGSSSGADVLMGKKISKEATPIKLITEEEQDITVNGYLFGLEKRDLKSGRILLSFNITDKTSSLACKLIINPKETKVLWEDLQEKKWYSISGKVEHDRFTQELTIFPHDIMKTSPVVRVDTAERKRAELHLHTKMSALDGLTGITEAVNTALAWGHPAVAITDHGVVQAFPEAYDAAKGKNIRLIYGLEGYLFDDAVKHPGSKVPTYHVIILAKNQIGLANLYRLVTLSHLQYFHRVPRIPKSELSKLREGLLVGSACEAGELFRAMLQRQAEEKIEEIASFYDYLEIQPLGNNRFMIDNGTFASKEDLMRLNEYVYKLGKKLGKPVVATCDVHFLEPEDEVYRRILMTGKGFADADKQAPLFFRTTEEMLDEFSYLGAQAAEEVVIDNPVLIAGQIEEIKPIPDELYPPVIPGAEEEIIELTNTKARELYGDPLPEIVQKRIEKELNAIISNGFAVLYWIAHKLVKKSNEDGYLVGSRGSVGSSMVAHLCGITEVNPMQPHYLCPACKHMEFINGGFSGSGVDLSDKVCPQCGEQLRKNGHNIPFEVFLGFKGDKVPDIDLNFSGEYQPRAHKYTEVLFGHDNVFRAGTIATVASKTAFGFVKNYFEDKKQYVSQAELTRLVDGCTGVKRTTGQHPGGVMVLPKGQDIHLFTPLQRPADDVHSDIITTHFDYHSISSRLVKLDILGHDDPTVIKILEDLTGLDSRTIPLDEPKVLSLFTSTEALGITAEELGIKVGTLGVPEFGTKFVRQMLEDTKPETFSDLVRISGFSHGTDVWLNNAQTLITSGTAKTSEVISARDDIMTYLLHKGLEPGVAFKIMEDVRKGKGVKPDFIAAMKEKDVPDWYIESCQKIKYMFPKAHAVAYVMMAFRIAYYKIYYPAAFYASYFTARADEFDADIVVGGIPAIKAQMEEIQKKGKEATQKEEKLYSILELALEMYLRKISVKKVDLLHSDATKFLLVDENRALLPPLVSLQGLGRAAAVSMVNARKEKAFISKDDLRTRAKLSKTVIDVLEQHGALTGLPESDQISLF
ncbi:MAG: PolC-type DNA polymerase III [Peptococcia bacterium]|jgi:DNA polymerase-3 subunit alpha (Gram-positive type)